MKTSKVTLFLILVILSSNNREANMNDLVHVGWSVRNSTITRRALFVIFSASQ